MKKTVLSAFVALSAVAVPAFAEGADYVQENRTPFAGQLSRAEIKMQLALAQQRGDLLPAGEDSYRNQGVLAIAGARDRSAVRAEGLAAAHSGTQNLKREAFVNSEIPAAYARGSRGTPRQAAAATDKPSL